MFYWINSLSKNVCFFLVIYLKYIFRWTENGTLSSLNDINHINLTYIICKIIKAKYDVQRDCCLFGVLYLIPQPWGQKLRHCSTWLLELTLLCHGQQPYKVIGEVMILRMQVWTYSTSNFMPSVCLYKGWKQEFKHECI